ncbi:hypothetical protein [Haloplasma contractile]|uniref:Uncharacterized protein n=1 Tax=Haloplasma contractile SSD-17B TaxID=1033810 RepID=F7Q0Y7_9MOLU|nr:hypothetical protein [Haloplasma contractile]ERJ11330.1 hypothetical protein HLPCO_002632 [Haloplasma contractile SSD-17B]
MEREYISMKTKRVNIIKTIFDIMLFLGLIGITIHYGYKHGDYVEDLVELSRYFESMGDNEKGVGYLFLHEFFASLLLFIFGLIALLMEIKSLIYDYYKLKHYPGIKRERVTKFYFNSIGIMIYWFYCYVYVFNVPLHYFGFFFPIFFPFQLLFYYINKRLFKDLDDKVKLIRDHKWEDSEKKKDLSYRKKHQKVIFIMFCILLITLFIPIGVLTEKYLSYRQYNHYPKELIITEETILDDDFDREVCETGYKLMDCYLDDVLDEYRLVTIVIYIDESDYSEIESIDSHNLRIRYGDYEANISEYYTAEQEQELNAYKISIDFRQYLRDLSTINEHERWLDIYYVDQDEERIDINAQSFELTFVKK